MCSFLGRRLCFHSRSLVLAIGVPATTSQTGILKPSVSLLYAKNLDLLDIWQVLEIC